MYTFDVLIITHDDDVVRLDFSNTTDISGKTADIIKIWDHETRKYLHFTGFYRFHIFKTCNKIYCHFYFKQSGIDYTQEHIIIL